MCVCRIPQKEYELHSEQTNSTQNSTCEMQKEMDAQPISSCTPAEALHLSLSNRIAVGCSHPNSMRKSVRGTVLWAIAVINVSIVVRVTHVEVGIAMPPVVTNIHSATATTLNGIAWHAVLVTSTVHSGTSATTNRGTFPVYNTLAFWSLVPVVITVPSI